MEIRKDMVKLDEETDEIHVYGAKIRKVKQDSLGRTYVWVEKTADDES